MRIFRQQVTSQQHRIGHAAHFRFLPVLYGVVIAIVCCIVLDTQPAKAALLQPQGGGGGGAGPTLTISSPNPPSGPAGTMVVVTSNGWPAGATVVISVGSSSGNCGTTTPVNGASGTANGDGTAQVSFAWPALAPGTYPVCGVNSSASSTVIQSTNSFTDLSAVAPSIAVPASVVSGKSVTITGANWLPGGVPVEVLTGQQGGNECATHLVDLTAKSDGTLAGTFTAPTVTATSVFTITAVSPQGTCAGAAAPTLHATATLTVTPASGGGNATATPTGHQTPTPTNHLTPTPTHSGGTNPVPAPPPGGPCPPLPSAFCSSVGGVPWCLLCLIPLLLLLLLILLIALFARRRNEEVVVSEEDITSQIDPDSVAPMGNLRYVRTVRETTQVVNRKTGAVRRSSVRVFDEFVDDQGNTRRRPQA